MGCMGQFLLMRLHKKIAFEEKVELMRKDQFKKKYPMFSNIDEVIKKVKSGIKIYSEIY